MLISKFSYFRIKVQIQIINKMKIFLYTIVLIFVSNYSYSSIKKDTVLLDSIFNFICEQQIVHPEIVIKQVIIETGWLTSPFLMNKKNLFGFRKKTYLSFNSWQESVLYYKKWQDKYYKDPDEDYYNFLVRIKYATNKYPMHLKKIKFNETCQ